MFGNRKQAAGLATTTSTPPPSYDSLHFSLTKAKAQSAVNLSHHPLYPSPPPPYHNAQCNCANPSPPGPLVAAASTTNLQRQPMKQLNRKKQTLKPLQIKASTQVKAPLSPIESPPQTLSQIGKKPLERSAPERNTADISQDALCELISSKFNSVITSIDGETFLGNEDELGD